MLTACALGLPAAAVADENFELGNAMEDVTLAVPLPQMVTESFEAQWDAADKIIHEIPEAGGDIAHMTAKQARASVGETEQAINALTGIIRDNAEDAKLHLYIIDGVNRKFKRTTPSAYANSVKKAASRLVAAASSAEQRREAARSAQRATMATFSKASASAQSFAHSASATAHSAGEAARAVSERTVSRFSDALKKQLEELKKKLEEAAKKK